MTETRLSEIIYQSTSISDYYHTLSLFDKQEDSENNCWLERSERDAPGTRDHVGGGGMCDKGQPCLPSYLVDKIGVESRGI